MSVELGLSATAEPGTFVRQGMVRRLIKKPTVIIAVVILVVWIAKKVAEETEKSRAAAAERTGRA